MGNIRKDLLNHLNNLGWMPQPYASDYATETVTAIGDLVSPEAPTNVGAVNGTERIKVEWDKVTKNVDGSDCNDLSHYNVYYSSSSGIDTEDDGTYDGIEVRNTLTWSQEVSPGDTKYYVVTAEDQTGNESPASNETSGTSLSVSLTPDVDDYVDNFDDVKVGNGIIGLIFRQPNSMWEGYSHYKLYRDELGGSSWTNIYEGPQPAYIDKGLSTSTAYKYKLTFVDVDGNETDGTVRDNSSSGYTPNNSDNSNITGSTFLAPNIVATNEVRGDSIYAESSIVLGGIDDSGYIKSSNYSTGSDGFKINADGSAEFQDITIQATGTLEGGESITPSSSGLYLGSNYLGYHNGTSWKAYIDSSGHAYFENDLVVGDPASSNYMQYDVSTSTLTVRGDITADSITTDGGNVKLGDGVLPSGGDGLYIAEGGGIEITDTNGNVVFDSSGAFQYVPNVVFGTELLYEGYPGISRHVIDISNETSLPAREYFCYLRIQMEEAGYIRLFTKPGDYTIDTTGTTDTRGASVIDLDDTMGIGFIITFTNSASEFSFKSLDNTEVSIWLDVAIPLES